MSEEERWQWWRHRLATSKACEILLGHPAPFGGLVSVEDAFEGGGRVQRLRFEAAEALVQAFTKRSSGEIDVGTALWLWPLRQEVHSPCQRDLAVAGSALE